MIAEVETKPETPKAKTPVEVQLQTAQDLFIRRWGEMGQTWGINRTQAEIHAFLYITGQPQCTDDVMERLNISRGNASMSLRALCDWGIIRRMHRRGERRGRAAHAAAAGGDGRIHGHHQPHLPAVHRRRPQRVDARVPRAAEGV